MEVDALGPDEHYVTLIPAGTTIASADFATIFKDAQIVWKATARFDEQLIVSTSTRTFRLLPEAMISRD